MINKEQEGTLSFIFLFFLFFWCKLDLACKNNVFTDLILFDVIFHLERITNMPYGNVATIIKNLPHKTYNKNPFEVIDS